MKRFCSMALALIMILSILPMSVFASTDDSNTIAGFTVTDNDKSTLAPGVTLEEVVMYNSNNQRVEMYVTTVDTTVDTVQVKANYLNNQNQVFGMQSLSDQVAAMEKNYPEPFKIVAGINASYYNTTTGQPTGAFVMEGVDASASGDNYAFFAVLKDGTYMIGAKGEYSKYKDQLQEAIGGYQHIVKDGKITAGLDKTTLYPRQTLGLTADGKLILMTADGSQAPTTVGTTIQEQAEIMLSLGCVEAIHLDGGNSATFGIIPEGEDKFVTKNSPSGGAERAVSNTLMIISTAIADGTFDHAVINSDYDYLAPYSTYTFSAFGVDSTNATAEIPENAVWTLSDDSFGTILDGKFISNGKLGTVDVQLSVDGEVVGSRTVDIANPTSASFALEETTVPYGKTASIVMTALKDNYAIYTDESHYNFVIDPEAAGVMNGFQFTACSDESVKSADATATYKYSEGVSDTIKIKFGKGSEVLFDFEDGDISDWKGTKEYAEWREEYNSNNPPYQLYDPDDYSNGIDKQYSEVFLATKENGGHVKSGDYALGFRMNHKNVTDVAGWLYNYLYYTGETKVLRDVANGQTAIRIGMWVYSPNITNVAFRIVRGTTNADGKVGISYKYMISDYDGKSVSYSTNYGIPESGWMYIYYNLTDLKDDIVQSTSISGATLGGTNANADYYPAFLQLFTGSAFDTMEDMVFYIDDITLDYSDVTEDRDAPTISDPEVCYDTANFVPLDGQTVNSNLLSFSAKVTDASGNSNMTGLDYTTARIYIDGIDVSGKGGFKASGGYITLNDIYLTNGKHSITFVIFDNQGNETRATKTITVNGPATNSVVSVVGRNDGNNVPKAGSVYYIDIKASDAAQISKIVTTLKVNTSHTIEYNNIVCAEGVKATAIYDEKGYKATVTLTHDGSLSGEAVLASIPVRVWAWDEAATGITADQQFATKAIPTIDIEYKTLYGEVVYADSTYANYIAGFYGDGDVKTELDNETAWHKHNAESIADVAATCTKDGYTDRTYCAGCASVVDWGNTSPATGHTYSVVGDELACDCGSIVTGTGLQNVDGKNYYTINGKLFNKWQMVDDEWYYFDPETYSGVNGEQYTEDAVKFTFENGRLLSGVWVKMRNGLRYWYGPGYYKKFSPTNSGGEPYEIDGKLYMFDRSGYLLTGIVNYFDLPTQQTVYYDCADDGVASLLTGPLDGYFYIDGVKQNGYKLVKSSKGDFYFIDSGHKYLVDKTVYLGEQFVNGHTYEDGAPLTAGNYTFDAEGKMVIKNGPVDDYFYKNNKVQKAYQLVEYEGNFYFIDNGNKILKNTQVYLSEKFVSGFTYADGEALKPGYYEFDADGKMIVKNGVIGDYFYKNGSVQKAYQLVEYEGNFYFIDNGNKLLKNTKVYLSEKFVSGLTHADGEALKPGYYEFDADGKMVVKNGIIGDYLYKNGSLQKAYQLVEYEGNFYFIDSGNKLLKNTKVYLSEKFVSEFTYADGSALIAGYYTFDETGKMVGKNGPIGDYFYRNDVRLLAYQLVEYEGNYYFIDEGNKILRNTRVYLTAKFVAGKTYEDGSMIEVGYHYFDENGKMVS